MTENLLLQVLLAKRKCDGTFYAVKVLHKKTILKKKEVCLLSWAILEIEVGVWALWVRNSHVKHGFACAMRTKEQRLIRSDRREWFSFWGWK